MGDVKLFFYDKVAFFADQVADALSAPARNVANWASGKYWDEMHRRANVDA